MHSLVIPWANSLVGTVVGHDPATRKMLVFSTFVEIQHSFGRCRAPAGVRLMQPESEDVSEFSSFVESSQESFRRVPGCIEML